MAWGRECQLRLAQLTGSSVLQPVRVLGVDVLIWGAEQRPKRGMLIAWSWLVVAAGVAYVSLMPSACPKQ